MTGGLVIGSLDPVSGINVTAVDVRLHKHSGHEKLTVHPNVARFPYCPSVSPKSSTPLRAPLYPELPHPLLPNSENLKVRCGERTVQICAGTHYTGRTPGAASPHLKMHDHGNRRKPLHGVRLKTGGCAQKLQQPLTQVIQYSHHHSR